MISRGCLFVDAFRVSYEITLGSLLDASWALGGCLLSSCRFLGLRSDVLQVSCGLLVVILWLSWGCLVWDLLWNL